MSNDQQVKKKQLDTKIVKKVEKMTLPHSYRQMAGILIYIIPFVLASFGSLVLSCVTTASGGAASPGLGGQRTPGARARARIWALRPMGGAGEFLKNKLAAGAFFPKKHFFQASGPI